MSFHRADFDRLFAQQDDPWNFRSSAFEKRKRALTLAALPQQRYASAFEPGCAIGELSAGLAPRCDALLATDGTERAVALATARLSPWPHVRVEQAWMPEQWPSAPSAPFDLIVLSEIGYFLDASGMDALADRAVGALVAGGTLLACHWRHEIEHGTLDGDEVHRRLQAQAALQHVGAWSEADFRIDVWQRRAGDQLRPPVDPPNPVA